MMGSVKTTLSILLFATLIGCGSSNSGPNAQSGTITTPPTSNAQLFFKSGSLSRMDPANPSAAPIVVDADNTANEFGVIFRTFDVANQAISDQEVRTLLYTKDDGHFYKVSTLKDDSHLPVQVSSEGAVATLCSSGVEPDTADHAKSILLYELAGDDADCTAKDDNVWKMLRLEMGADDAPLAAKEVVSTLLSKSTGGIVGFLAIDGANLVRCDQNFKNCGPLPISISTGVAELEYNPFSGFLILLVDDTLYSYSVDTGVMSASLYTFSAIPSGVESQLDASHAYFMDGAKLVKLALNGSANASILVTESGTLGSIKLTSNKVVYLLSSVGTPTTRTLKAVGKNGGSATTLLPATTDSLFLVASASSFAYYTRSNATAFSSGAIKEDGTDNVDRPNALWISFIFRSSFSAASGFEVIDKILWLEGCATSTCANGTLKSVDAASHSGEISLGTIPADISLLSFSSLANEALGFGVAPGSGNQLDLFYIKADQADSLLRITTTPTKSEFGIPFF